jgi:Raf kinase inhibitor-like YbhB/YbcL family protein
VGQLPGAPRLCWHTARAFLAMFLLAGCGLIGGPSTVRFDVPNILTVTSPDLIGGKLGLAYTCGGAGRHPAIHWSGAPAGTKSLAVVMDDSAAPITPEIYWIVFNIGPQATDIPSGPLPPGAREAQNSKGSATYDAPCPRNSSHDYRFTVYALGRALGLPAGAPMKSAWLAIAQAAIARGRLTVTASP